MKLSCFEKSEYERYTKEFDFSQFMKDKTFLVTGSGGMTGQSIVKWILYENELHGTNAKIYASTRRPDKIPDYIENSDNVEMCEFGKEADTIGNAKVDYIIHAASPTERDFFMKYPAETFRIIIDGCEKMLELCRQKNASFILLSTVEVYGALEKMSPVDECETGAIDSMNIRNGYPLGKKGSEFLSNAYFKEYGCNTRSVRISAIQGLYQPYEEQRIFNEIARCIIEDRNLLMRSDGMSKKSIVYTLDAVSGIFVALFKGESGEVYNITNPSTFFTMNELVEKLFSKFNNKLKIEYEVTSSSHAGYLPHLEIVQSIEKISLLGWKPITGLEQIYEIDINRWKANS